MARMLIKQLFAGDIYRRIEEVIKVDQTEEQVLREELGEYVLTDAIREHYKRILRSYWETPKKPHEGIAIWVSGFFGSGKSSFAKMLGLALQNRTVLGESAASIFAERAGNNELTVLLKQIAEHVPTDAVIFDVSTDRGIKSGNQTLTEIMYRLFLKSLGYAEDLDLAGLETALEQKGELERFEANYRELFDQDWNANKDLIAFSLGEASTVMNRMFPDRYPTPDSWVQAVQDRADITPGRLAERCKELMTRRRPERNLVFVVDEVGQFVARDVQKMLDLQAAVQSLGRVGRGKIWIVVTSQEKLTELVGGLDDKRVELARLMDRFPLQVHLEPSDISEVTSKRVLAKNAAALDSLRDLYSTHNGRLTANTRLSADIQLPDLSTDRFQDLYPLLPYQIDLIIQVVSGLRTQGGASKHVGGANRTIIKLAQQLLIHDGVKLAEQPVGQLATIDQIYDLIAGNIPGEIRGKINAIKDEVTHPLAQKVAKAICLLQYVKSIHRTAENIASALHPAVSADSLLSEAKEALRQLVDAHKVRLSDNQYRIPTPAEDDWDVTRASCNPKPGDVHRIYADTVTALWEPRPAHNLLDARTFKGGLVFNGRPVVEEDIAFHVQLAEVGADFDRQASEARARSQSERKAVFWVAALDEHVDRETVEVFRSREILARKERGAKTKDETALVADEKRRQRDHESELKRLLRDALLAGSVYFQGNDRSPGDSAGSVSQAASRVLVQALPEVYDRFAEGAARVAPKDLDALLTNENLRGLTPVFGQLGLVRDEKGQTVFNTETGVLKEVMDRIENKTNYGETATGRYLADEFEKEPFGWSLDVVRLFVVALVRAGKIKATSKGTTIESALTVEARNTFAGSAGNNVFKACSFQKRVSGTDINDWLEAEGGYREVFGRQLPELQGGVIAEAIRRDVGEAEEGLHEVLALLLSNALPGATVLQEAIDQMRAIRAGSEDDSILTFNATHRALKDAIKRANELRAALTEPRLEDLRLARKVLDTLWPFLDSEADLPSATRGRAEALTDLTARETFYRELPSIDQHTAALAQEYAERFRIAVDNRATAYQEALNTLQGNEAWSELNEEQQARVAGPLASRTSKDMAKTTSIPFLRAELSACPQHLKAAVRQMMELIEGNRLVTISVGEFFAGRVETPEQLDTAIVSLRQRIEKLLGEGKKVWIQ
jgi:hypothetical protein